MKLCFGSACVNGVGECPERQASENHYPGRAAGMRAPPTIEGTLELQGRLADFCVRRRRGAVFIQFVFKWSLNGVIISIECYLKKIFKWPRDGGVVHNSSVGTLRDSTDRMEPEAVLTEQPRNRYLYF